MTDDIHRANLDPVQREIDRFGPVARANFAAPAAMTPEQLDKIRERSTGAMQAYSTGTVGTPPNVGGLTLSEALDYVGESAEDVPDLLAHVDHLAAENARLHEREGLQWESCGTNRLGQPTGRWVGPIEVGEP